MRAAVQARRGRDEPIPATTATLAAPAGSARSHRTPVHRDRNVLRWISAYTCAHVGDQIYFLALSWSALQLSGAAVAGTVTALAAAPRLLLMLGGGVVADRFGPRRVAIWTDAARAVVMVAAASVAWIVGESLTLLVVVALVFGAADALFLPAVGAMPLQLVEPRQLARVQGLRGLGHRFSSICGPPLGGGALVAGGLPVAFGFNGLVFAGSVLLLFAVRSRPDAPRADAVVAPRAGRTGGARDRAASTGGLRDGLRHVRSHRLLGPLLLFGAVSEIGFAGVFTTGVSILTDERGWGPAGLGWLGAGFGLGATVSALLMTFLGRLPRMGLVLLVCTSTAAIGIAGVGLARAFLAAVVFAAAVGFAVGILGIGFAALVQTVTEPAYLGRVTAVAAIGSTGLPPLVYPLLGLTAERYGATTIFIGGAVVVLLGTVIGVASRAVRSAELD